MVLYAERGPLRARQIIIDAAVAVWVLLWIRIGWWVHDLVDRLAGAGRNLEGAGASLERSSGSAGNRVEDLPVVGGALAAPFGAVAEGGRALGRAGEAQQDAVGTLALVLALVIALLPIAWLLARWLPGRLGWIRDATAARALLDAGGDTRLFALRAMTHASLPELRRAEPDPLAAYEAGRLDRLAALELRRLGVTTPTP